MKALLFAATLAGAAALVVPAVAESTGATPPASGQQSDDAGVMPMANAMSGNGMMVPMMGMMRMMSMMGGYPNMMGQMPAGTMMGGSPAGTGGPPCQPHSHE
jgi:hypothetical protein